MRRQALIPTLLALALALLLACPGGAGAAEVLQVRGARLLQVGDRNRSVTVELACLRVDPTDAGEARDHLRRELPRGTRVNLRPLGERDGHLLARVQRLEGRPPLPTTDVAADLIAAGLGQAAPCP